MVLIITLVAVEQYYDWTIQTGPWSSVCLWLACFLPKAFLHLAQSVWSPALMPSSCMSLDMELCHILHGRPTSVAPPTIYVGTPLDPVGILLSLHMTKPPQPVPPQYGADPLHSDSPPQLLTWQPVRQRHPAHHAHSPNHSHLCLFHLLNVPHPCGPAMSRSRHHAALDTGGVNLALHLQGQPLLCKKRGQLPELLPFTPRAWWCQCCIWIAHLKRLHHLKHVAAVFQTRFSLFRPVTITLTSLAEEHDASSLKTIFHPTTSPVNPLPTHCTLDWLCSYTLPTHTTQPCTRARHWSTADSTNHHHGLPSLYLQTISVQTSSLCCHLCL